ncbi:hypothetical protein HDU77_007507 [Chytriomyces hyalinus]|nr:hypothetical protein HDU77_007507 [Chytriomyces hyalinus]
MTTFMFIDTEKNVFLVEAWYIDFETHAAICKIRGSQETTKRRNGLFVLLPKSKQHKLATWNPESRALAGSPSFRRVSLGHWNPANSLLDENTRGHLISGRIASALRDLSSSQFRIFRPTSQQYPGHDIQQPQTAGTAASTETTAFQPMLWSMYQDVSKSFWKQAALTLMKIGSKAKYWINGNQNYLNWRTEKISALECLIAFLNEAAERRKNPIASVVDEMGNGFDAVAAKEMNDSETVVDVATNGLGTEQMEDSSIEEVYVGKHLMTVRRHQPEAAAAAASSRELSPAMSDHLAHSLRRRIETLDSNEDEIEIENGSFIQEDDMTDVPLANDNEDVAFLDFINQIKTVVGRQELSNQVMAGELDALMA